MDCVQTYSVRLLKFTIQIFSGAIVVSSNGRRSGSVGENDVSVVVGTVDVEMLTSDSAASDVDDRGGVGVVSGVDRSTPDTRRLRGQVGFLVHESDPGSEDVQGDPETRPCSEGPLRSQASGKAVTTSKGNVLPLIFKSLGSYPGHG